MKLGMPQLYEFDSIKENVELALELKLDFIELNLNFSYCRKEMEDYTAKRLILDNNLEATLHFYDEADFASYDEVVDAYLVLLEKYAKLGEGYVRQINVHNQVGPIVTISGEKNYINDKEYNDYINRLIKNLTKASNICNKYGITLVIENTNIAAYMKKTYADLAKNNFYFTYDIGHDDNDKYMLYNIIKTTPIIFKEFHIHDGDTKKCHLALNEGKIDIKEFKEMAKSFNAYVVLEVKSKDDLIKSVPVFNLL
jgi:sugar phosphate isomerase/epimerase